MSQGLQLPQSLRSRHLIGWSTSVRPKIQVITATQQLMKPRMFAMTDGTSTGQSEGKARTEDDANASHDGRLVRASSEATVARALAPVPFRAQSAPCCVECALNLPLHGQTVPLSYVKF